MPTEDKSPDYEAFIRREIENFKKSTKYTWIGGSVMILFVGGYLLFVTVIFTQFLDPQASAGAIVDTLRDETPGQFAEAERILNREALNVARDMDTTFRRLVPEMSAMAGEQIRKTHEEVIPHLSWEFQQILTTYISENGNTIRAFSEDAENINFPENMVRDVMDEMGVYMDQQMKEESDGKGLAYMMENTQYALEAMDEHLDYLVHTPVEYLDDREILQKRILASIVQRLLIQLNQIEPAPVTTIAE